MKKGLYTHDEITIEATIERVWEVLTNSDHTVEYMYGCEIISDWKIGQALSWRGKVDGIVYVKGQLLAHEKNKHFGYSTFDPNGQMEDISSNYLHVDCTLKVRHGHTILKISQGDYNAVAEGKSRYEHSISSGGWSSILKHIKNIAESQ